MIAEICLVIAVTIALGLVIVTSNPTLIAMTKIVRFTDSRQSPLSSPPDKSQSRSAQQ